MANQSNRSALISYLTGSQASGAMGRNYVINPSGFQNVNNITVTNSATVTRNTTAPLTSIADLSLSMPNNATGTVLWSTATLDNEMSGQNCEFRFSYTASSIGSNVVAVIQQGSDIVAKSLALGTTSIPQVVSVNAPCGDLSTATTVGIINDTGNTGTSAISIANLTYGRATNLTNVSQAEMFGSLRYAGATSCNWISTSAVWAGFAADADCATPTVIGNATAPGTKIPGITFTTLPAGRYMVIATGQFQSEYSGSATQFGWAISDGTSRSGNATSYSPTASDAANNPGQLIGVFEYTTAQSNITFQPQVIRQSGSGTAYIINQSTTDNEYKITVYKFPTSSQVALNSNLTPAFGSVKYASQASCQWIKTGTANWNNFAADADCPTPTTIGNGSPPTTANTPGAKFNNLPAGSYLVIATGAFRSEASSGSSSVLWRISDGTNSGPFTEHNPIFAGSYGFSNTLMGVFTYSSFQSSVDFQIQSYQVSATGRADILAGNTVSTPALEFVLIPLSQNLQQPLLVGSVTSNTTGLERIERASISSGSVITSQSGSWITSVTDTGTGSYQVNIASGIFSSAPSCTVVAVGNSRGANLYNSSTTSAVFVRTYDPGVGNQDLPFELICMGPR